MPFLDHAQTQARQARLDALSRLDKLPDGVVHQIDGSSGMRVPSTVLYEHGTAVCTSAELVRAVVELIEEAGVEIENDDGGLLRGAQATLSMKDGILLYHEDLDAADRLLDKLLILSHELGHIVLHADIFDTVHRADAMFQPGAWSGGAAAAARYSKKARIEAEANAFAAEFVCPAGAVFSLWHSADGWTPTEIAEQLQLSDLLVQVQLAEGFRDWVRTGGAAEPSQPSGVARPSQKNAPQRTAVTEIGRPVIVAAGPGTGKTKTLIERVGHLLRTRGEGGHPLASARDILALTFTNEAADELRERVEALDDVGDTGPLSISTFHGFGYQLLHSYGDRAGLAGEVRILDNEAQEDLLLRVIGRTPCLRLLDLRKPRETVRTVRKHLTHLKNHLVTPTDLAAAVEAWEPASEPEVGMKAAAEEMVEVYRAYEALKHGDDETGSAVDFGDLILVPHQILTQHADVRAEVQRTYRWVLVDEYQDVGRSIARLLQQVCGPSNPPWAVGDARQAIHRFRGAAPENVAEFADDFRALGEALPIDLKINYRSGNGVVRVANQLATLIADPLHTGPETVHWTADGGNPSSLEPPVIIAEANCYEAERHHIVRQVQSWLASEDVRPSDIAVLARRNVDVRRIGLELRTAGIPVSAGGIVTAEGAGGDMAAVAALLDSPRVAVPRLAGMFGRLHGVARTRINEAVRALLAGDAEPPEALAPDAGNLVDMVRNVERIVEPLRHSADAWSVLVTALFGPVPYLRAVLGSDGPEADLALEEISTALAIAAGHRFARPELGPCDSRKLFVEHFRQTLVSSAAKVDSERTTRDAVRVMTCHAAKGLEFPFVIVSGQTGAGKRAGPGEPVPPPKKPKYPWIPPTLQPDPRGEWEQEDALLFVGVTRAKRQAVVSYAATANDLPRSPRNRVVGLLQRWLDVYGQTPPVVWHLPASSPTEAAVRSVWGGTRRSIIPSRRLDDKDCPLRDYLRDGFGMRFRTTPDPLYPEFFGRLRSMLQTLCASARTGGGQVSEDEARELFERAWPVDEHEGHPHAEVYRDRAWAAVRQFAANYQPDAGEWVNLEPVAADGTVSLDLVSLARDPDGRTVALGFRPESLAGLKRDGATIKWGEITGKARLPFALPAADHANLRALVFSGEDGTIYEYAINRRFLGGTIDKASERFAAIQNEAVAHTVRESDCDRCEVRIACPFWMGLLPEPMMV